MNMTTQHHTPSTQRARRLALALVLSASAAFATIGSAGVALAYPPGPGSPAAAFPPGPGAQDYPPGPSAQDFPPGPGSPAANIIAV